jgi:hypothetical protein
MSAFLVQVLDDLKQVTDGSGQAIKAHHDQSLARLDVVQESRKNRTTSICAGRVLLVDWLTAHRLQFIDLWVCSLLFC